MNYHEILGQANQVYLQTTPTPVTEASGDRFGLFLTTASIAIGAGAAYYSAKKAREEPENQRETRNNEIPALGPEELKGIDDEDDFQNLLEERNT